MCIQKKKKKNKRIEKKTNEINLQGDKTDHIY